MHPPGQCRRPHPARRAVDDQALGCTDLAQPFRYGEACHSYCVRVTATARPSALQHQNGLACLLDVFPCQPTQLDALRRFRTSQSSRSWRQKVRFDASGRPIAVMLPSSESPRVTVPLTSESTSSTGSAVTNQPSILAEARSKSPIATMTRRHMRPMMRTEAPAPRWQPGARVAEVSTVEARDLEGQLSPVPYSGPYCCARPVTQTFRVAGLLTARLAGLGG